MKIKNYTTTVSAEKSIHEIEKILSQFGATHVMKTYSGEQVIALAFRYNEQGFQLPANIEKVEATMFGDDSTKRQKEQAQRTAWRLIKDWVYSQISIILVGQAEMKEVFLPYLWNGKRTLYQAHKEGLLELEHRENGVD